jgi:2-octaprenyl-6-methoxyphenol hydroxylase
VDGFFDFDAIIVGGGVVGCALAVALRKQGMRVALIDRIAPDQTPFDNRVFSLSLDTLCWLEELDMGPILKAPIETIRISSQKSQQVGFFEAKDIQKPALGYMVPHYPLRSQLQQAAFGEDAFAPENIDTLFCTPQKAIVQLASGKTLNAPLIIGADGRASYVRQEMGVPVISHAYPQKALTFLIQHQSLQTIAYEHFFPGGSLAVLPMVDNQSAVVWIDAPEWIDTLVTAPQDLILEGLNTYLPGHLGDIKVQEPRHSFPLYATWAQKIFCHRCILVGDAAQAIHPIIGQGVNVGLREARTLVENLLTYKTLGLDWGCETVLEQHAKDRKINATLFNTFTAGLVYGLSLWNIPGLWSAMVGVMNSGLGTWFTRKASLG